MKLVAQEEQYAFPYLYDDDTQEAPHSYGAQATPHAFVFDKQRTLRYVGRMDDARRKKGTVEHSYIRNTLDALLAGKEIPQPSTRAFGGSTKWRTKESSVAKDHAAWAA